MYCNDCLNYEANEKSTALHDDQMPTNLIECEPKQAICLFVSFVVSTPQQSSLF